MTSPSSASQEPRASTPSWPALRWGLGFSVEDENPVLRLNGAKYKFAGVPVSAMFSVLSFLNGHQTSGEAPDPALLNPVVGVLLKHELAVDLSKVPDDRVSPEKFVSLCRSFFPVWKQRLVSHPLWGLLSSGEATQAQFVGWLIENFHFIEGIHDRLSVAISECYDPALRSLLTEHYAEEHDHSYYFMSSLNVLGYDAPSVMATRPLPGTRAVLNFMRQCGRRDPLQYGVCTAFFEASGGTREAAEEFYGLLMKPYVGEKLEAIDPLVEHVALDNACGHDSFIDDFVGRAGEITISRASDAISSCALLVETLYLWTTDMMRAYDRPDAVLRNSPQSYRPALGLKSVPKVSSADSLQEECRALGSELLNLPFWQRIHSGAASPNLLLGWVLELHHYAAAANEYLAAAVAYCHDNIKIRRLLVDRYFEQHQQSELLMAGLVAAGFEANRVRNAQPLASTRALINFLSELATSDWLAFIGAVEILAAVNRGTSSEDVEGSYGSLAEHYPFAAGLLNGVKDYALTNSRARQQSSSLFESVIEKDSYDSGMGLRLTKALRDTFEHFVLFFEGIEDFYSDPYLLLPRAHIDLRTEL